MANAFRNGTWVATDMAGRAAHDLGVDQLPWMDELAAAVVTAFPAVPHDGPRELVAFIASRLFVPVPVEGKDEVNEWIAGAPETSWIGPRMSMPTPIAMGDRAWPVPEISTVAELARFLRLDQNELEWYADVRSLERHATENLRHYDYHSRQKARGGVRLIEAPKQNLKYLQRKLLRQVLAPIPPHESAHGFRSGRSIQSFAAPHTAQPVVIRLDLTSFFTRIAPGRIFGIFRTAGYSEDVGHLLTGLVTNATPGHVLKGQVATEHAWLRRPHLPQGSPTSPALANLAAYGLDRRLTALASSCGARYTRYADDLALSGGGWLKHNARGLIKTVQGIVRDEGFLINVSKTRVRTQTERQVLTGLVVNRHLNVHRRDYDQLKAVLHEAATSGTAAANRTNHPAFRAHVEGRISFVHATNPQRARKLWRLFDQVAW